MDLKALEKSSWDYFFYFFFIIRWENIQSHESISMGTVNRSVDSIQCKRTLFRVYACFCRSKSYIVYFNNLMTTSTKVSYKSFILFRLLYPFYRLEIVCHRFCYLWSSSLIFFQCALRNLSFFILVLFRFRWTMVCTLIKYFVDLYLFS